MKGTISNFPHQQRGFVLPVGMLMLAVMTIIGISSMKDSAMQERMASNYIDKEKSFQAAESALRVVQRASLRVSYEAISSTADFVSIPENPSAAPDYANADMSTIGFEVGGANGVDISHLSASPRVVIEELSNTSSLKVGKEKSNTELARRHYRVTAYATGDTPTARTTLQGVILQE